MKKCFYVCVVLIAVMMLGLAGCTRESYGQEEMEKSGVLMSWAKQEDGTYKLVHGESGQSKPLDEGRLEQFE